MNKKQIVITLIALVLVVATLFAVLLLRKEENPELQRYSTTAFGYFDTVTTVSGYAESGEDFQKVANEIGALLDEYHKLYDIYNEYEGINNLCTINKLHDGEHRAVKVDRKIIDMLLYAKNLYTKTNGKMNIAMGSILSIWHDYREEAHDNFGVGELPPMADLEEAALHTDINNFIIDLIFPHNLRKGRISSLFNMQNF